MEQIELDRPSTLLLANATSSVRAEFYRKTYMHLALAFLLFVGVEAIFLNTPFIVEIGLSMTQGWIWMGVLVGFMLVTSMAEKWALGTGNKSLQYAGFGLYILAEAFLFVPLLYIAMSVSGDGQLLAKALGITLALFVGLTLVVFTTKQDFSFLKSALMIGGVVAFSAIGAGIAFGFDLGLWFSVGMIVLAAGSILYQTSNLVHRYETSQYVAASLGLFASFMLLLWYIIQFFLSRD
jgi:FtsH-binding integral membrane protein